MSYIFIAMQIKKIICDACNMVRSAWLFAAAWSIDAKRKELQNTKRLIQHEPARCPDAFLQEPLIHIGCVMTRWMLKKKKNET